MRNPIHIAMLFGAILLFPGCEGPAMDARFEEANARFNILANHCKSMADAMESQAPLSELDKTQPIVDEATAQIDAELEKQQVTRREFAAMVLDTGSRSAAIAQAERRFDRLIVGLTCVAEATEALLEAMRANAPESEITELETAVGKAYAQSDVARVHEDMDAMAYEERISVREFLALDWKYAEQREELSRRIGRARLGILAWEIQRNNTPMPFPELKTVVGTEERRSWTESIAPTLSPPDDAADMQGVSRHPGGVNFRLPDDSSETEDHSRVPDGAKTVLLGEQLIENRENPSGARAWAEAQDCRIPSTEILAEPQASKDAETAGRH